MTKTEIMALIEKGSVHERFTHSIEGEFDITAMREWASKNVKPVRVPISEVIEFVTTSRVMDVERVRTLTTWSWRIDPALAVEYVNDGKTEHLLVDGTHRIMRRHLEGQTEFPCWIVPESAIVRPNMDEWCNGEERGLDWGDELIDGKIVKRGN